MTLAEQFSEWLENVGTDDADQGYRESMRWVEECGWTEQELSELFSVIQTSAFVTAAAEGRLLEMGQSIVFYALRFGIDLEAKKHLPSL